MSFVLAFRVNYEGQNRPDSACFFQPTPPPPRLIVAINNFHNVAINQLIVCPCDTHSGWVCVWVFVVSATLRITSVLNYLPCCKQLAILAYLCESQQLCALPVIHWEKLMSEKWGLLTEKYNYNCFCAMKALIVK